MPRCSHDWRPLIAAAAPTDSDKRLAFAFSLSISRLDGYDKCAKCGRLSWITNSRARRRVLVSPLYADRIEKHAAEFDEWAKNLELTPVR